MLTILLLLLADGTVVEGGGGGRDDTFRGDDNPGLGTTFGGTFSTDNGGAVADVAEADAAPPGSATSDPASVVVGVGAAISDPAEAIEDSDAACKAEAAEVVPACRCEVWIVGC